MRIPFSQVGIQLIIALFVENTIIFPLLVSIFSVINQLVTCVFPALFSFVGLSDSIAPTPRCLAYCSFIINLGF